MTPTRLMRSLSPKVGEYTYFCGLHPRMKGKIVVTP